MTSASQRLNRLLRRHLKIHLCRLPAPRGWLRLHDLQMLSGRRKIERIFDVGANVGQSALEFAEAFPGARIDCFEPVRSTFQELARTTARCSRIEAHAFGFSETAGQMPIHVAEDSVFSSLSVAAAPGVQRTEMAEFRTIDGFLEASPDLRVDLLKIDTEGHDLEVLKGASGALEAGRIGIIQVECGIGRRNPRFQALENFVSLLEPSGFGLMGIYDQRDWEGELRLGFANAVFVAH